jgi:hypothetical protein
MLWQAAIRSNAAPSLVGSEATVDPGKGGSNPGIRELSDSGEIPGKHDSARQENAFGLTSALNMLIERTVMPSTTPAAISPSDVGTPASATSKSLTGPTSAAIAHK